MKKKTFFPIALFFIAFLFINAECENSDDANDLIELTGKFISKKGVMTKISCYCFDTGYLMLKSGDKIPICFEDLSSDNIKCPDKLRVKGNYKTINHEKGENDPCREGEMKIFMVKSYFCD